MASNFITLREAAKRSTGAGVTYTRPTLKLKLFSAMENDPEKYEGMIIHPNNKGWIKVNIELFDKWIEETFNVRIEEKKKKA